MFKYLKSFTCYLLTFAMLITLLPPQAYEASTSMETVSGQENDNDILQAPYADAQEGVSLGDIASTGNTSTDDISLEDAQIVMELTERRTEYSKEYKLDNGLNLAVVYSEPVHYKENGKWEEIDNTLSSHGSGESASYKNKAGAWQVEFPLQLDEESKVKITKGDYTVSFLMSGELRLDTMMQELRASEGTAKASKVKKSQGKVHKYDYSKLKEQAQHPEVIRDNLRSRMTYSDVYTNTDVIYDLDTQQLKESIVINTYAPSVYGYVYTLDTGKLVPVLNEDGSVDLLTKNKGEVVMAMPAPFMIDNEGSICTDVAVTLEKVKGTYQLTYLLPMEWMEDENRAWPVILDPVVKPGTKTSNILDHFVAENYSASNTHKYLYAGHHATYGDMRTYIQFSNIPDFTAADVVVNAKLKLNRIGGSSGSTIIEAHEVYDTWTTSGITWSGQPSWNPIIQDYCSVGGSGEYFWDITDVAYGWYLGENTGVMLKATTDVESSSTANWKQFCSAEYNKTDSSYWPYLEITYQTATGIEEYWDYTTTSAGRAGNGYINNTTGNLTWVHSDLGFDGNRMPVSITHIYTLSERSETKYGLGKGWRTNFHQTVELAESGGYYIWRDGDGTMHDFNPTGTTGIYKDEDGLRLTLTVSADSYTITDIYGNTSNFDASGRLVSMVNNQEEESQITITYNGTTNRIDTITDGVGRLYKFEYDTSNRLNYIRYYGTNGEKGEEITNIQFTYNSSSKLTKITYKDGLDSHFTYDGTRLLTAMDIDDYKVKFGYSTGITKRAVSVEEYDGTIAGNKVTVEYAHNKAKISDKKHTVIYHYNDYGNLISTQDDKGSGQFYKYKDNNYDEIPVNKNKLSIASKQQDTVSNLILDSSFEGGSVWNTTSVANCTITTSAAYLGTHAIRVAVNTTAANISAYGAEIAVPAGKTCTFSAYVRSESASVRLGMGTTSSISVKSDIEFADSKWKRMEVSYTNKTKAEVKIRPLLILGAGGYVYVDCVQAEISGGVGRYNLIQNGDFKQTTYWTSNGGSLASSAQIAAPQLDTNVYKIVGNPTGVQSISQVVKISGNAHDAFVLSGWAKGNSVPLVEGLKEFGLRITFNHTDGSSNSAIVSFNSVHDAANDWQYAAGRVEATEAYSSVKVEVVYNRNMNDAYFDGIQLYKEELGERYTYDGEGNVETVTDALGLTTVYQYTGSDPTTIVDPSGITTVNTYTNHNLASSRQYYVENGDIVNLTYNQYSYDDYGNQIRALSQAGDEIKKTFATYSTDGNHLASTTDELGNVTEYVYNENKSVLESVQYPKDTTATKTLYSYDNMFRLTGTSTTTSQGKTMSAGYVYTDDLLAQVTTASSVYKFQYGDFALRTKVSVGNVTLAEYTYKNDSYHSLETIVYGNGKKVKYSYDDLGRVTQEEYFEGSSATEASKTVTYEYDSTGALAMVYDHTTGIKTRYYYDNVGRNAGMYETAGNVGNKEHSLKYYYDELGRLKKYKEYYGEENYITEYTYNDQNQVGEIDAGWSTEKYTYDKYGRLKKSHIYHSSTTTHLISKTVEYQKPQNGNMLTSNQISEWTYLSTGGYSASYSYSYDANGNIISETVNGKTTTYVYDSANQLIRENNQAANKTWTWTYDGAGNIKSKKEYIYTTGTLGTVVASTTYDHENENWGDLLTAINGTGITYDAIGNMLNDGTRIYTWKEGRKLATLVKGSATWTFGYDANGMRTKRTAGSTVYNYTYHGSQLTHMTYGSNVLHFYYDASGKPLSVVYNGVTYYYVLNLQGDVVGILDSNGVQVVGYRYDAWGRPLATTGTNSSLALHNPLRYRGYVYDRETELYYVSSRYYNPEIGRWINPEPNVYVGAFDSAAGLVGYNVYVYCANNPINYTDPTGEFVISTLLICVVAGAIIGGVIGGVAGNAYADSKGYTGEDKTKAILMGIGIGAFAGGTLGAWVAPAVVGATGVAGISVTSAGISTIAAVGTSFGQLGTLITNNGQQVIDWGKTTLHGMQRMAERGVTQNMVEAWVKTGKALQQTGDKILYVTKQGVVVISKAGQVITTYTSQYFDATMKEVVEKLFGK